MFFSERFISESDVFAHFKILDETEEKGSNFKLDSKLSKTEIVIFKKKPIFESVLKNIVT